MTQSPDKPYWQRPVVRVDQVDPLAESESLKKTDASHANGDAQSHDDAAEATPLPDNDRLADAPDSAPGAVANGGGVAVGHGAPPPLSVVEAQRRLVNSQMCCARATEAQGLRRGKAALALEKFQRATMQTQTFEQLAREHIASSNQERADRKAGKIPQRGGQRRLGSAVDAHAFYTRNHGRAAGGGGAFRRGARPASARTPK